ncbi:hypothetical protein Glove_117g533 [Diversispora epigaea]|uniref:Protein kinase domain-containing protein n=1 Tax=Diversispora epigaea TaxID=1348612 RepID=A0A397J0C4_9GLOM|nr:hypothetical protein Glove_117g533 [Diversispora epigaea]
MTNKSSYFTKTTTNITEREGRTFRIREVFATRRSLSVCELNVRRPRRLRDITERNNQSESQIYEYYKSTSSSLQNKSTRENNINKKLLMEKTKKLKVGKCSNDMEGRRIRLRSKKIKSILRAENIMNDRVNGYPIQVTEITMVKRGNSSVGKCSNDMEGRRIRLRSKKIKSILRAENIMNDRVNGYPIQVTEITMVKRGNSSAFGTVYRANPKNIEMDVALKSLHENDNEKFYKKFVKELKNISTVNYHDNIIKFYGICIDSSTETYYLVLQYAKDGDLRTYLQNNFNKLDWKIKIQMAKDITSGLNCIHEENIVHKDLHSKNILVHERRLLITDLGLSQSLDANSISISTDGGIVAYADPEYLRNKMKLISYKRDKASDIYSLGVLFWELSSGRPPFNDFRNLDIYRMVISGEREKPINKTPKDYIDIYSSAWEDKPNQRPTIKNIFDSLENIKLENIYNNSNDNQAYTNNQSQASMNKFIKDSISFSSFTASNLGEVMEVSQCSIENTKDHVSDKLLTDLENPETTGIYNSSIHENNSNISNIS